jgi:hypothetical protein
MPRPTTRERILRSIVIDGNGCWIWQKYCDRDGYGRIGIKVDGRPRTTGAHRIAFVEWRGEIPEGLEPDHACEVRPCVNPDHMELKTHRDNVQRSVPNRRPDSDHCRRGHLIDEANTYHRPGRPDLAICRTCRTEDREKARTKARTAPEVALAEAA